MKIDAIKRLNDKGADRLTPLLTDYAKATPGWTETEFRHFDQPSGRVIVGFWTGEAGEVTLDPWPYTEICSILTGRVAVRDTDGNMAEFSSGEAFMIPKGFVGDWITVEAATKIFIAVF